MYKTAYYIDLAKKNAGITSDYMLAKLLNVDRRVISNHRNGRPFSDEMTFRIAILAQVNPAEITAAINEEKARTPEKKKFWRGQFRTLRNTTGLTLFAVLINFPMTYNKVEAAQLNINNVMRTSDLQNNPYR